MRQQPPKRRFPGHHIVDGADPPIIGCQQISPMLGVACKLLDSTGGTDPTLAHQLSEKGCESVPRQLRTQRHWYAVKFVVDPAAKVLGFRRIEALRAAVLEPGSDPTRLRVIDARFMLEFLRAFKTSR